MAPADTLTTAPGALAERPGRLVPDPAERVAAWAAAVEAGVLARAALADPGVPWRGDATDAELADLDAAGRHAQQEFVAANIGLVGAVLGPWMRGGVPVADLFQEGCLGLILAVERFDHRRGVRFSTYATYWIRSCLGAAASQQHGAVRVPVSRSDQLRVAHGVESTLSQQLGRQPSAGEVAEVLGRDVGWTATLLAQRTVRSLEELDERTLHRVTATEQDRSGRETEVWARRLLATLDGFDRQVLERRLGFGGGEPTSLAAVARELGVPVGRVRRAESRALELLRGRCPHGVRAPEAS